jgi:hypothetical protein
MSIIALPVAAKLMRAQFPGKPNAGKSFRSSANPMAGKK